MFRINPWLLTCIAASILTVAVDGAAEGVPLNFPGHLAIQVFNRTEATLVRDLDHDGWQEILAGHGDSGLAVIEFGQAGLFNLSGIYVVGGRVVGMAHYPGPGVGGERVLLLTRDPDQLLVMRYLGPGAGFVQTARVDLPEDPGAFCLGPFGLAGELALAVTLPGIDAWMLLVTEDGRWRADPILAAGDRPGGVVGLQVDGLEGEEIVVADTGPLSGTLSVFSRGAGGFALSGQLSVPALPSGLHAADQDADGQAELLVSYGDADFVSVYAVEGGALVERERIPTLVEMDGVLATALAGDDTGLWCWNTGRGFVQFFRRHEGIWEPIESFYTGSSAVAAELADVNGDGQQDLVVANGESGHVSFLFGNELPSHRAYFATLMEGDPQRGVLLDEDGDGHLDMLVPVFLTGAIELLRGDGAGHLTRVGPAIELAGAPSLVDTLLADGDTVPDLVVLMPYSNRVQVWCERAGGGYELTYTIITGDRPSSLAKGDLDGDGFTDLAIGNRNSDDITLVYGLGDGTFGDLRTLDMPQYLGDLVLVELNADPLPDLVVSDGGYGVYRFMNLGERLFGQARYLPVADGADALVAGDYDGDGDLDVGVVALEGHELHLLENLGTGDLLRQPGVHVLEPAGGSFRSLDINQDSRLDIVATTPADGGVSILSGLGGFLFAAALGFPIGDDPTALGAGDLDHDGRLDLVVMDTGLDLIVTALNIEPNPVSAEILALDAECGSAGVTIRFAMQDGVDWSLDLATGAGTTTLATAAGPVVGELTRSGGEHRLRLTAGQLAALDAAAVGGQGAALRLRVMGQDGRWRSREMPLDLECLRSFPAARFLDLAAPYPNPFNPTVRLDFTLSRAASVEVAVWDLRGHRVATLYRGSQTAGTHGLTWDGWTGGRPLGAGSYLVTVAADGERRAAKLTLLK